MNLTEAQSQMLEKIQAFETQSNINKYIVDPTHPIMQSGNHSVMIDQPYFDIENPLINEEEVDYDEMRELQKRNDKLSSSLQEFLFIEYHPEKPNEEAIAFLKSQGYEVFQHEPIRQGMCYGWMLRMKQFIFQFS